MTAALALATALLIAPAPPRHRLLAAHRPPRVPGRVVVGCVAAVATLGLFAVFPAAVVVAAAIVCATLETRRRRSARIGRRAAEGAALQAALDVLVGELRVGAHPVAACAVAARESDGVVSDSLRIVAARARMGADVAAAMLDTARHSPLPTQWESIALCWRLAQSHGLGMADLMKTAQLDIAERDRFSARVTAGMAGARTTGAVLACLPVIGVGLGQVIGAEPLEFLLGSAAGGGLLIVGVTLACAGLLWSDRITDGVLR